MSSKPYYCSRLFFLYMQPFQNQQIDVTSLPKIEDLEMQGLQPSYKNVLLIGRSIFTLILLVGVVLFFVVPIEDKPVAAPWIALAIFLLITVVGYTSTIKGFYNKKYALREKDIVYHSGWLWQQTTIAPFNRVQHVSIDQGPIERQFGLSKLKIFTAGGSASDMSIPGLDPETANSLKEYIVKMTAEADEDQQLFLQSDREEE